jgi:1-acyl-sn-glycerol-3-phosphate acyltransferase
MKLPPPPLRRLAALPLMVAAFVVSVGVLALSVIPLALVSAFSASARRLLRSVTFAPIPLGVEAVALLVAAWLWIVGACRRRPTEESVAIHFRVLGRCLRTVVAAARVLLRLELEHRVRNWPSTGLAASARPLLILCRHAGPGDSVIVLDALVNRYGLRPRLVMKESMQLDPVTDVYFHRLPVAFVSRDPESSGAAEDAIRRLAGELRSGDALVMFPEGGNYTPRRRRRAIRHLARTGRQGDAARAEWLRNVMPPRPGGVLAVLDTSDVDVVVIGHTGLGGIHSVRDSWRSVDRAKPLILNAWFTPSEDVPSDRVRRIGWLFDVWSAMDDWVQSETADVHASVRSDGRTSTR